MKRPKKLKLYVWENVFNDYTSGIAFALAYNADHARKLILEEYEKGLREYYAKELVKEPLVITKPEGFSLSGGG